MSMDSSKIKLNEFNTVTLDYLSPEILSTSDRLKAYVWHTSNTPVLVDRFAVIMYEEK